MYISKGTQPDEVVRICTELVRSEFERFTATARQIVEERAQEFVENYMCRQADVAPAAISSMEQPYMQRALQHAQVEYASSGDADLGSLLVDLVVELSQKEHRGTHATALQDALTMAPRLTTQQMNALTVVMLGRVAVFHWRVQRKRSPRSGPTSSRLVTFRALVPTFDMSRASEQRGSDSAQERLSLKI